MRLTILLLFISCSFLILTSPAVIFNLIMSMKLNSKSLTMENYIHSSNDHFHSNTIIYYSLARFLMIIHHSINFILYFVVGKRFRRDLKHFYIICRRKLC